MKAFLPDMISRGKGHIVNIASAAAFSHSAGFVVTCSASSAHPGIGLSDYCMSKAGLVAFHNSLRLELHRMGASFVQLSLVCPYIVDTGMFSGVKFNPFVRLLFPTLRSEHVADEVVEALRRNRKVVILPGRLRLCVAVLLALPTSISDWITSWVGGRNGMDHFQGHDRELDKKR